MPQKLFDINRLSSVLQCMRSKAVAKSMNSARLGDTSHLFILLESDFYTVWQEMSFFSNAREQVVFRAGRIVNSPVTP